MDSICWNMQTGYVVEGAAQFWRLSGRGWVSQVHICFLGIPVPGDPLIRNQEKGVFEGGFCKMYASLGRDAASAKCTAGPNTFGYFFFPWAWPWTLQKPPSLKPPFLGSWFKSNTITIFIHTPCISACLCTAPSVHTADTHQKCLLEISSSSPKVLFQLCESATTWMCSNTCDDDDDDDDDDCWCAWQ